MRETETFGLSSTPISTLVYVFFSDKNQKTWDEMTLN